MGRREVMVKAKEQKKMHNNPSSEKYKGTEYSIWQNKKPKGKETRNTLIKSECRSIKGKQKPQQRNKTFVREDNVTDVNNYSK